MGSLISRLIDQTSDICVLTATEHADHHLLGTTLAVQGSPRVVTMDQLDLTSVDAVVDFSIPEVCIEAIHLAKNSGCAVVSGTTGLSAEQMLRVREAAESVPVLWSPNMSLGVNLFFRTISNVSRQLGDDYDVEVVEIHHRHKKDAPSGTAKRILELLGREAPCHSLRVGDVVGEHQVHFAGQGERIILTHHAESRETFARGVLAAIRFICSSSKGLYTMFDVLDAQ